MQCGLSAGKQKLTVILVEQRVCRLPRELGACTNSVYQALFPPPPHKSLGMRLEIAQLFVTSHIFERSALALY